jgi:hypothetical protein
MKTTKILISILLASTMNSVFAAPAVVDKMHCAHLLSWY